ncbi:hypothetical protein HK101_008466 [Irineochytrium annulatum]|nr:hypothetical protein HK101_008466 [Irineochytrium annulatum]
MTSWATTKLDDHKPSLEVVHSASNETLNVSTSLQAGLDKEEILFKAKHGQKLSDAQLAVIADDLGKAAVGYDPTLEWTDVEEKRILWILDSLIARYLQTRLMPFILFSTFILNMDRTNLSNALSDNLTGDLHITIDTVNNTISIYAVVFTIATFAGAIVAKAMGPHRWIPVLMFSWGLVTLGHAIISNAAGFWTVRVLIALTEGGVIPATLVYLGGFYTARELATRLSWFWGVQSLASAASGLMASGILTLKGVAGLTGWKWLFLIDGVITLVAAVLLYYILPASATSTAGGLRFRGWFSDVESRIAVTRVIRADPVKLYYDQNVEWADVVSCAFDSRLWGHLIITAVGLTPLTPLATYLPSIIASFGFNVYVSNALTAPGYILLFITMATMTANSDRTRDRSLHGIFSASWLLIGFIVLRALPDNTSKYVLLVVIILTNAWPLTHPVNIAWMTENMAPLGKRTVATGAIIGAANIFQVWAAQIYRAADAPRFHTGNNVIIAFCAAAVLLWYGQRKYYQYINASRQRKWDAMTKEERATYEASTTDLGNDRLDFRFTI